MTETIVPRIISLGRVTIPIDVRRKLDADEGDFIVLEVVDVIKNQSNECKDNGDSE
jgi:bifunctional DNA-binding transcriptional regulator/antitoxin component of YhaV-PrlF toxin-antitoxin module